MKLPNNEELAYIAGLIDGEGTVSLKKNGTRWPTVLEYILITNTDKDVLDWVQAILGRGKVYTKTGGSVKSHWRTAYVLRFPTRDAREVLDLIYPYLRIKKGQADILYEFAKIGSALGIPERMEQKRELMKQVQSLNKNGHI